MKYPIHSHNSSFDIFTFLMTCYRNTPALCHLCRSIHDRSVQFSSVHSTKFKIQINLHHFSTTNKFTTNLLEPKTNLDWHPQTNPPVTPVTYNSKHAKHLIVIIFSMLRLIKPQHNLLIVMHNTLNVAVLADNLWWSWCWWDTLSFNLVTTSLVVGKFCNKSTCQWTNVATYAFVFSFSSFPLLPFLPFLFFLFFLFLSSPLSLLFLSFFFSPLSSNFLPPTSPPTNQSYLEKGYCSEVVAFSTMAWHCDATYGSCTMGIVTKSISWVTPFHLIPPFNIPSTLF